MSEYSDSTAINKIWVEFWDAWEKLSRTSTFKITIPKKSNGTTNNTTSKMYGKSTTSVSSPSGRQFTLA